MKTRILFAFLPFLLCAQNFQAQDYMDIIAEEACLCLDGYKTANRTPEEIEMQLGICLISAAAPYKKELKKKHDIDLDSMDEKGAEKLGMTIGIQMAAKCPDLFLELAGSSVMEEEEMENLEEELSDYYLDEFGTELSVFEGKISGITTNDFVKFTITQGNESKEFYWFDWIDGGVTSENFRGLMGTFVMAEYAEEEMFDPDTNSYVVVNVLTALDFD